ncbi:tRNA (adenosine(37)-N6)-threonylcarbamoyltransferase complex ATPase subunit type 1 TsaE [Caldicellulosiruptoraceae bacterium PP1]
MKIVSNSYERTIEIGNIIGQNLKRGSIVCLDGELGAGKTALTLGISKAFGVDDVSSPTFTIFHIYYGNSLPIFHFDVYRIEENELEDIGYEEFFYDDGITIIEWADKLKRLYPRECLKIYINILENNDREIEIIPIGNKYMHFKDVIF